MIKIPVKFVSIFALIDPYSLAWKKHTGSAQSLLEIRPKPPSECLAKDDAESKSIRIYISTLQPYTRDTKALLCLKVEV